MAVDEVKATLATQKQVDQDKAEQTKMERRQAAEWEEKEWLKG